MSEIEELLKKHTDDVGKALEKFAGQIETVDQAVKALTAQQNEIELKANRISLNPENKTGPTGAEVKELRISAEDRKTIGSIMKGDIGIQEAKQMQIAYDSDGGIFVPDVVSTTIEMLIRRQSPVRQVAKVLDIPNGSILFPLSKGAFEAGWIGENDDRPETATGTIASMRPSGGTVYALPSATEEVIDDAIVNLEQFITENVIDVMAEKESQAFISGDGIDKPRGFIKPTGDPRTAVVTTDATRALGVLQYIPTGNASTLGTLIDNLVAMVFATKAGYRQAPGCSWLASTDMIGSIAKIKDSNGNPIFLPSMMEGVPGMLLGYPVIECEHMDAVGAGAFPIAFGNWKRGYVVGDRRLAGGSTLSILKDPYTTKGRIKWYFRKRVYGEVLNSEAIKLLKVSAS
jgi:HK97 family phage major capsid protein